MLGKTDTNSMPADTSRFATTHWSLVLAAGSPQSTRYREALETLCQIYWVPLYVYLRRRGYDRHQAEDYTQSFFANLLERQGLQRADPKRGKFRFFLLTCLKNFVSDERGRAQAQKRGGHRKALSLDVDGAESRYGLEPVDELSPERLFEKFWAMTLLRRVMKRLRDEFVAANKEQLFDHLKAYITAEHDSVPYSTVAVKLDMKEVTVRVSVHRIRLRYRELVRQEIAHTVTGEEQVDEEIHDLFTALSS
jgi:RNA polymerase sigma factor (sigma-70 family)